MTPEFYLWNEADVRNQICPEPVSAGVEFGRKMWNISCPVTVAAREPNAVYTLICKFIQIL